MQEGRTFQVEETAKISEWKHSVGLKNIRDVMSDELHGLGLSDTALFLPITLITL